MARTAGARNYNFDVKRAALLDSVITFALSDEIERPSLRQLALAAGTSEPTLRHYFTDRKGLIIAMMAELGERARPIWQELEQPSENITDAIDECFRHALTRIGDQRFFRMHAFGMVEGMAEPGAGQAYLEHILEPSFSSICNKLSRTPGAPDDPDEIRSAAIAMFSPVIVTCLHQHLLGGRSFAPLDDRSTLQHLHKWLGGALLKTA
nr:TetR/AcrR family transcriptional regulator [uncultured Hyphomonas sp.]